jgi:hypothetical protein
MESYRVYGNLKEQFQRRFERAAAKGHEESIWIRSVVKDVDIGWNERGFDDLKWAFAETEELLGYYFAGELSDDDGWDEFAFNKKSAEGGCSWGQVAYGWYFNSIDGFVECDDEVYLEWLEKAANQNNPKAMHLLGEWFQDEAERNADDAEYAEKVVNEEKAVPYYRAAAELGWKRSMDSLAKMLSKGEGCVKDLREAAIWGAKGGYSTVFWELLEDARRALEIGTTEDSGCDFDQLCYSLGWGFYWHQYESEKWNQKSDEIKDFGERCLDYYCATMELQRESIFTFLLFWNRATGVKPPGQMIAQMVWDGREDNLVEIFEQNAGEEPEMKRIKK